MRTSLFLMEQLIAITVFAICAAVCVRIFAASYTIAGESRDLNNALIIAKNGAECFKAVSGSAEDAALVLGGNAKGGDVFVFYGEERNICAESEAAYVLSIEQGDSGEPSLVLGDISVKSPSGNEILTFAVAARRAQ